MNCERFSGRLCCWHLSQGMMHMVVPEGHVVLKCCQCSAVRTEHFDHGEEILVPFSREI